MTNTYKIKRGLILPMALAVVISIPVFVDIFRRGYGTGIVIMASFLVILFYLFTLNNILRRVIIDDSSVCMKGLFGTSRAPFTDIRRVDGINFGSRQFIAVTAGKNLLIPNSFERFDALVDDIISRASRDTVADGIIRLRENLVNRRSDVTLAWIVVILLAICNVMLFLPYGLGF
jgi:hypothetical protein